MNILLLYPPSPFLENARCEPPLGLMYLAGAVDYYLGCAKSGISIDLLDLGDVTDYDWVLRQKLKSKSKGYDIVGVSVVTPQYPYALELCNTIRAYSDAKLVVGGPHVTVLPESIQSDVAIVGQGERPFVEVVQALLDGQDLYGVIRASDYPVVPEPLWHPDRDLVDLSAYSRKIQGVPATTLITSYGCPNACRYCMRGTHKKFSLFSADYVCEDLRQVNDDYGYTSVLFVDDTFTFDLDRLKLICEELKRRNMTWRCWTRVDRVTPDMLSLMRDHGCTEISFGVESGSQKLLDAMNKNTTVEMNHNAIRWAKASGITTKAFVMVGIPGETRETVEETKALISETNPDQFILSLFTPIVGSHVWYYPEKYGLKDFNRMDFAHQWEIGKGAVGGTYISTDVLSAEELKVLHAELLAFLRK